jgi:hypothetical protein
MAGRGPASSGERSRKRDADNLKAEFVDISADGELHGPELPDVGEMGWHPQTIEWWNVWRRSAQASTFTETDWSFLLDTALLHSQMWTTGDAKLAAEIRLRAAKHGATLEDRMRLKISVHTPNDPQGQQNGNTTVSNIADRRKRLSGA